MADHDNPGSIGSDEVASIVDTVVNPEGYGIEGEFVPVAVFEGPPEEPDVVEETEITAEAETEGEVTEGEVTEGAVTEETTAEFAVTESAVTQPEEEAEEEETLEDKGEEIMEEGEETMEEIEGEEETRRAGEEQLEGEEIEGEGTEGEERIKVEGEEEEEEEEVESEEEAGADEISEEGEKLEVGEEEGAEEEEGEVKKEADEGEGKVTGVKFEEEAEPTDEKKKVKKEAVKRRLSIRKKSIFYTQVARLRSVDERRISGDFAGIKEGLLGSDTSPPSILSFCPESGEYSYEEIIEEEEEVPPIDREYYYNIYRSLAPERIIQRMKNNFLHRKMADYFKKRKMEHVLKETDEQIDSQHKYDKKLDALADLRDLDTRERNSISSELNDMRAQRDDQLSLLNTHFTTMQNREKEIGTGLINTKTGKEIPDKVIERLLKRQKDKWMEVAKMRLSYIKIRDRVAEKKVALHALDCIGENLHLMDYEQLKIENQSHTDKIEERDEELTRLRVKCRGEMQCLAHIREKSAAIQIDIQQLTERYEEIESEYTECRERLNYFKQERDYYRFETDKLCEESGLLSKPKLLQDMEIALENEKIKTQQLKNLMEENQKIRLALKAIKKNITEAPTKLHTIKEIDIDFKSKPKKVYRGRPTLIYPQLPESDWSGSNDAL